jgi:hypothetical protein
VRLAPVGEVLQLPFMHAGWGILAVRRWAKPWVAGIVGATHRVRSRAVLDDPCAYLTRCTDGPAADSASALWHLDYRPRRSDRAAISVNSAASPSRNH